MLTLLVDTSTEQGLVVVARGEKILAEVPLATGTNSANALPTVIKMILENLGILTSQLQCIAAGIGPGSYTGIRVAVIVAKCLAFAHQLPLIGISSLKGFIPKTTGSFAAVIDAKIGGVYTLLGKRTVAGITYLSAPALTPLAEVPKVLEGIPLLVTPNAAQLRPRLAALVPAPWWGWEESGLQAQPMMHRVQQDLAAGKVSMDGQLEILYLRRTQAEIERLSREHT